MLKIFYSDTDITLEQLATTPEAFVAQRSVFALRVGQSMFVQAGRGSLLLPTKMPGVTAFWRHAEGNQSLTIDPCDYAWVEVTLEGIWMARTATSEQGSLVVDLGEQTEWQLVNLWRCSLRWMPIEQPLPKAC